MTAPVSRTGFSSFFASQAVVETVIRDSNDAITLQDLDGGIHAWNHGAERMYGYTEAEALAMNVSAIATDDDSGAVDYLQVIRGGGEAPSREVRRRTKDGRILEVWLTATRVVVGGAIYVATTERDVTEQHRQERSLRFELSAREKLNRISSRYLTGGSEEAVLGEILDAAIEISEASFGNIQILDAESGDLAVVSHRGFPTWWVDYWNRVTRGRGACGTALERHGRVIVEDVARDPIFIGTDALDVQLAAGVRAVQSTPLIGRAGTPIGMMSTHYTSPQRPPSRALPMLDLLASQAAEVIERAQSDAALQRSEATAAGILEASADALISIDSERRIRRWNPAAEAMFGFPQTEAIGASIDLILPERYRGNHRRYVSDFAAELGGARTMDHRTAVGLRANGEEFPISATISKFAIGRDTLMTVAIRDVTEARRTEEEHRLLSALGGALASNDYDATLENITRLVVGSLAEFAVLFVEHDASLQRVAGASRDPMLDRWAGRIMELVVPPQPDAPVWKAFTTQRTVTVALSDERYPAFARSPEHLAALRATRPRTISCLPLVAASASGGVLCIASASRALEPRDLQLAEEIARRCALYIDNARLHRLEQQAMRARDEVLAVVAHDLRNPLSTISLYAELLHREAKLSGHANVIVRTVQRMNRIVEDLLDVARLDVSRLGLKREPVCPAAVLATARESASRQAAVRGLTLQCDVPVTLPAVYADAQRIQQVFDNLIGNAVKFTERGGISIGARADRNEVEFWVADTGRGIAPQDLDHVFDPFWQARPATRSGAGLGLAISKGIIEAHGGRMRVESTVGVGTTMLFTLPTLARAGVEPSEPDREHARDAVPS
jgi:PAS domain S-box-containing protein